MVVGCLKVQATTCAHLYARSVVQASSAPCFDCADRQVGPEDQNPTADAAVIPTPSLNPLAAARTLSDSSKVHRIALPCDLNKLLNIKTCAMPPTSPTFVHHLPCKLPVLSTVDCADRQAGPGVG
jgi:hypothetical protein